MPSKHPSEYNQQEVNIFLNSIGLGKHIESFESNGVDGAMIVTLTKEDLTNDLEMSNLQARKFQMSLDFATQLAEGGGGSGSGDDGGADYNNETINSLEDKIRSLEAENSILKEDVNGLNDIIEDLQSSQELIPPPATAPAHVPPPAPAPKKQDPKPKKGMLKKTGFLLEKKTRGTK